MSEQDMAIKVIADHVTAQMNAKLTASLVEAQNLTGLGRDRLRKLVKDGTLPNVGAHTRIRIPRAALERFVNSGGQQ